MLDQIAKDEKARDIELRKVDKERTDQMLAEMRKEVDLKVKQWQDHMTKEE